MFKKQKKQNKNIEQEDENNIKIDENQNSIKDNKSKEKSDKKEPRRDGRADHVVVRNLFAFNILRRTVFLTIISTVAAFFSLVALYQVFNFKTPPQYVQLTEDGRLFPITPLNLANVNDGEIIQFANDSVKWINTYDYRSWKDQLQINSNRFNPRGWGDYLTELNSAGTMNTVQNQKMVVYSRFTGPSQIVKSGVIKSSNTWSWVVDVPVNIYYEKGNSGEPPLQQKGVVTLYIVRVPLEVNLRGYAIVRYQFDTTRTS